MIDYCSYCDNYTKKKPLEFIGKENPDYYIIGDLINYDEKQSNSNELFSAGVAAEYLYRVMTSVGMSFFSNTRGAKLTKCFVSKYSTEKLDKLRSVCNGHMLSDLALNLPKVIILLGTKPAELFLGSQFSSILSTRGKLIDYEIYGSKVKIMVTYSPEYITSTGSVNSDSFYSDFDKVVSYVEGKIVDVESKNLVTAYTYNDYIKFKSEYLINAKNPSYDIETNATDPRSEMFKIVGFSSASDSTNGLYILRNSLDYNMPEDDWNLIVNDYVETILATKKVIVHNSMYEVPSTYNSFNYYMTDFIDTLVKARLLLGGSYGAGLKNQCATNLHYPNWEEDLHSYEKAFMSLVSLFFATAREESSGQQSKYLLDLNEGYLIFLNNLKNKPELSAKESKILLNMEDLLTVLKEYYLDDAELNYILILLVSKISELASNRFDGKFSYAFLPSKIIARYGAMDAVATCDLNQYYDSEIEKLSSELKVDLHNGYEYMLKHYIVGTSMEMNGMQWNDDVANSKNMWCEEQCLKSGKAMILSGFLDDYLYQTNQNYINEYLLENCMQDFIDTVGSGTPMKSGYKLSDGSKLIPWKQVIDYLPTNVLSYHKPIILDSLKSKVQNETFYLNLKSIFNPGSTTQDFRNLLNSILVTPEIKIAHFYHVLYNISIDPEFDRSMISPVFKVYLLFMDNLVNYNNTISKLKDKLITIDEVNLDLTFIVTDEEGRVFSDNYEPFSEIYIFKKFNELLYQYPMVDKDINKLFKSSMSYVLDSFKEENIIELNSYYLITGIPIDDSDSWTPNYKFLMNYRMWKKCTKIITTYINGDKVGRGSVWVVDKDSYVRGDTLTPRKRLYDGNIAENETTVMQTNYNVCGADSFRWRSGMHTLPSESNIKHIYTSRFEGGCIAAPDFSQMELRTMAGESDCKPLIQAFAEGADIHLMNACRIFNKKAEEVTDAERRYSKMASFMILYGGDADNFGDEFLAGDRALAHDIYNGFYSAYPEIESFIKEKHNEMSRSGKVTSKLGFFLNVNEEIYGASKAPRVAQNAPIQLAASMIAGLVLYHIYDFIKKNNYKSKVVLFVHDSLEIDIHPDELIPIASQIIPLMNEYPLTEFGIPTKADLVLGKSLGQEVIIKSIEAAEDYSSMVIVCEGDEPNIDALVEEWSKVFNITRKDLKEPVPNYVSWKGFWIPKKAISENYGGTINHLEQELFIEKK